VGFPLLLDAGTTGKIAGQVIDAETGMPLAGANVIVEGTVQGTAAGGDGVYTITNLVPGIYSVTTSMIGYASVTATKVQVFLDLTTRQDFSLSVAVIEGESVTVEATRPLIQRDITASRTIQSGDEVIKMPVDNYTGALQTIAGAVVDEDGGLHFRGGREGEVTYLLDNSPMVDPLSGNNDSRIISFAIQETHTLTGGIPAEYGNAQSGVINVVTKDGGDRFSGQFLATSSAYGISDNWATVRADEVPENLNRLEFGLSGPAVLINRFIPGNLNFLITGDLETTQGRYLNQDRQNATFLGKLTYHPLPQLTLRLKVLDDRLKRELFSNLWKKTTVEDGIMTTIPEWAGNGVLDTEDIGLDDGTGNIIGFHNGIVDYFDINLNGQWDEGEPTEDLNKNGAIDSEDLNRNGQLDELSMLDHLSNVTEESNQYVFSITQQLSERTFYELKLSRYWTRQHRNALEEINEDIDGDGHLDITDELIEFVDEKPVWIDLDGDGYLDRGNEDLNSNGILDLPGTDLFSDRNGNEYVDASEVGPAPREYFQKMGIRDPESMWMPWADIPYRGEKDSDGFYTYGAGTTWDRRAWYIDESAVYGVKLDFDSQIDDHHLIRTGFDLNTKDIYRHDGTDRYGYGEKFKVHAVQFAAYFQDKMEYGDMIVNIGVRYDFFDARWDNMPNDLRTPTWTEGKDEGEHHEDLNSNGILDPGEDANGNDVLDQYWSAEKYEIGTDEDGFPVYQVYLGQIKDPRKVPVQDFISPRFGVSYPITDADKMYFSYGRYFSAPLGINLYRNLEFDMGGGYPVIGNPSLESEKTTEYEAGVIHAFRNHSILELKGFFKNVTGLTNSKPIYINQRDWYGYYVNADYGTIRGFELTFTQRPIYYG
ncbi:MAG: TonB-dependent receptor, partial [Candidatus Marinimicrobia bacterium]|nr:TonB-dependent receptor [Candidatus Neomarinimicrobiota bacterium]